jgi:hypothetical protein
VLCLSQEGLFELRWMPAAVWASVGLGVVLITGGQNSGGVLAAADPIAAQAQLDLTIAYNDAASRTGAILLAGNLGGRTLTPGL